MLYIYSDEVPDLNALLLERLGPEHTLVTIPISPQDMAAARHVTDYFRHAGLNAQLKTNRVYRDPGRVRKLIMRSSAVFLMGGNTFEYLAYARRVGLFAVLQEFEAQGGVILADSAGSIILTPNIATALIPTTCPDHHTHRFNSYTGMGRIPFHISPHFDNNAEVAEQELHELQALAYVSKIPVMVLRDGEGFIMEGQDIIHTVGNPKVLSPDVAPPTDPSINAAIPSWAGETPYQKGQSRSLMP